MSICQRETVNRLFRKALPRILGKCRNNIWLKVKMMGIVDAEIPYGGYDTLFIPLKLLSEMVPAENLNYQFIVDTDDNKWEAVKDEVPKIIPRASRLYVSTLDEWVGAYRDKLLNYHIPVYVFVMFIGFFGILNLLNITISLNKQSWKRCILPTARWGW